MIKNALSFDVEDWFHVQNYEHLIPHTKWDQCELRVVGNMERILELLGRKGVRSTFYVLGWVAERCPEMMRRIIDDGHEIGTHGYRHQRLTDLTPDEFRSDVTRSLEVLGAAGVSEVNGYRAPSFSIVRSTLWALEILEELRVGHDSSIVPSDAHPSYGIGDSSLVPHRIRPNLWEIPLTVLSLCGKTIPCGGGGYFRLLPYRWTRWALRRVNTEGRPCVFYLHPWEIDPGQPAVPSPFWRRFRQRVNLSRTLGRLERLLDDFEFGPMGELVHDCDSS